MKRYNCPICNTSYKYKSMADRCIKTSTCKKFNSPDQERLNVYTMQICSLTVIQYFIYPFCEQYKRDDALLKIFNDIKNAIDNIYSAIGFLFINPNLVNEKQKTIINLLSSAWPSDKEFNVHSMIYIIKNVLDLLIDNISEFWNKYDIYTDQKNKWHKIFDLISTLDINCTISQEEKTEAQSKLYLITNAIFPKEKSEEKHLQLYLLNNKFWITAFSRQDARKILLNEYGIVCTDITGINPAEKMEDGRTAQDMIDMATGQQKIIGRTE